MAQSSLSSGESPPYDSLLPDRSSQLFSPPQSFRSPDRQYSAARHRPEEEAVVCTRDFILATMTKASYHMVHTDRLTDSFPFMRLPGEQREAIYRALFDDLVFETGETGIWSKRVPAYNLRTYLALIQTCHQVNLEASSVFLKEYLPQTIWYFDDLRKFYQFSTSAASEQIRVADAAFVLKTPVVTAVSHGISTMMMKVIHVLQGSNVAQNPLPQNLVEVFFELEEDPSLALGPVSWSALNGTALDAHYKNGILFRTATYSTTASTSITMKLHRRAVDGAEDDLITINGRLRDVVWSGLRGNAMAAESLMHQWAEMRRELIGKPTAVDKVLARRGYPDSLCS